MYVLYVSWLKCMFLFVVIESNRRIKETKAFMVMTYKNLSCIAFDDKQKTIPSKSKDVV